MSTCALMSDRSQVSFFGPLSILSLSAQNYKRSVARFACAHCDQFSGCSSHRTVSIRQALEDRQS